MRRFLVFFLAALGSSDAQKLIAGKCSYVQPMKNFQLESFLGTWYDSQTYSVPYIVNENCSYSVYSLSGNATMNVAIREVNDYDGSLEISEVNAALLGAGVGELAIFIDSEKSADGSYVVVGTDYKNWATIFGCIYSEEHSGHANFAELLTRNRKPSKGHIQAALATFKSQGVDTEPLRPINQEHCANN